MKLFGEKRLVNSVKLLPLSIKSINPIQKYPHITESYDYILKIFAIMFLLLLVKFSISFGMFSTPKLSKYVTVLVFTYNAIQCHNTHEDLLHMPHLLFCQANYLWNKAHQIWVHFDNTFIFQGGCGGIKHFS